MDVTDSLELDAVPQKPTCNGDRCDIYNSQLHDRGVVAIKIPWLSGWRGRISELLPIWANFNHPNIVQLVGKATFRKQLAAIYDWHKYGSIRQYLEHNPTADRYQLSAHICEGVAYLHANGTVSIHISSAMPQYHKAPGYQIHGHLNGDQILVSEDGVPRIQLSIATSTTAMDAVAGWRILRWEAPEIIEGSKFTVASDVYSLGMEAITRDKPYGSDSDWFSVQEKVKKGELPPRPTDTIPQNDAGNLIWRLLRKCWSFKPEDRPSAQYVRDLMHMVNQTSDGLALRPLKLVVTEETSIHDLVAHYEKRCIMNYTELLHQVNVSTAVPFADTALANVYKINLPSQQRVAVKCVKHTTLYKKLKRAARELSCWSSYEHDNILPVLGFAVVRGDLAMISPWMSNGCVTEYVVAYPACNRMELCIQLTRAIAYLHEHNLVHGDVKGPNVLVSESGVIKVTDFGVSIMDHKEVEFSVTLTCGTQRWQAPEILLGRSDSAKEGDVYALGMEIYTGRPPYGLISWSGQMMIEVIGGQLRPSRPTRLPPDNIGNKLWELMNHCWAGSSSERPTSGQVYEQLQEISDPEWIGFGHSS